MPDRTRSCTSFKRRAKRRVRDASAQDVERLHERQARLEQRGQLLVEDQELARADPAPPVDGQTEAAKAEAAPPDGQHVQPLLFELAAQPRLVLGDVGALGDLARRCRYPAPEFHAIWSSHPGRLAALTIGPVERRHVHGQARRVRPCRTGRDSSGVEW